MTCEEYDIQLGDYVDGALDAPALASFEAHLAACGRCQAVVSDFRAIRQVAADLGPLAPPAAAWHKIAAAVEEQSSPWWRFGGKSGFTLWQPAMAMAMALLLTVGLTWVGGRLAPLADQAPATAGTGTVILANAELDGAERDYTSAIAGLEQIARDERDALDPDTADVLDVNLTVIDTAIGESRAVLKTEPENDLAIASLFEALKRKLSLLQDAVALINEMRKGNSEGAARIVSGLNQ
jgi:anti-sigma factor RsiW